MFLQGRKHLRGPVEFAGPPSRWISDRGKPAACIPFKGMPAYDSEHAVIAIMETLIATFQTGVIGEGEQGGGLAWSRYYLMPRSYGLAWVISRGVEALCALHHSPDAVWSWRPRVYWLSVPDEIDGKGSQQELDYRHMIVSGLTDLAARMERRAGGLVEVELPAWSSHMGANERAESLLLSHLNVQQRLEYSVTQSFHVPGEVNKLYLIEAGNGFSIVSPWTGEKWVSYCFHPEYWIPDADIALATKLLIDQGKEGEEKALAGGNPTVLPRGRAETAAERWMMPRWRELLKL